AILAARVRSLAIHRGWIVGLPEDLQQLIVRDFGWIELDLDNLGVSRLPGANLLVSRVRGFPARIPGGDQFNSFEGFENRIQAPKTTAPEDRCLSLGLRRSVFL